MTYRKLTKDEILEISNRIRYEDQIDFGFIRNSIKDLFGPTAHKIVLSWGSYYNDETNSHRPDGVTVWDAVGNELTRPPAEDDDDEELYEFFRDLDFGDFNDDIDTLGDTVIFINGTKGLDLPDLYIQES